MSKAWSYFRNNSEEKTFSQCLKMSWAYFKAKNDVVDRKFINNILNLLQPKNIANTVEFYIIKSSYKKCKDENSSAVEMINDGDVFLMDLMKFRKRANINRVFHKRKEKKFRNRIINNKKYVDIQKEISMQNNF